MFIVFIMMKISVMKRNNSIFKRIQIFKKSSLFIWNLKHVSLMFIQHLVKITIIVIICILHVKMQMVFGSGKMVVMGNIGSYKDKIVSINCFFYCLYHSFLNRLNRYKKYKKRLDKKILCKRINFF